MGNRRQFYGRLTLLLAVLFWSLCLSPAATNASANDRFANGYAETLGRFVDSDGLVDYQSLKANRGGLDSFADSLAALDPARIESWNDSEKIAFWINAYNALTLRSIIDNYPIKSSFLTSLVYPDNSIRQIDGVWDKRTFEIAGQSLTLEQIEHSILRGQFNEPRIHVALVCAAMGCPQLRNVPYSADSLDAQLESQALNFIANPEKFRIDSKKGKVYLSSIFEWFGQDFETRYANGPVKNFDAPRNAALNFILGYMDSEQHSYLAESKYKIEFTSYDWSLNERPR
ncbi:DUF547 domain-containing protein [Gemmatimonadota bacterium]